MLRTEVDKSHRGPPATVANYITLSWTTFVIRFSEKDQLIDCLDVLNMMYGSVGSANTAQTKWFGKGEHAAKTAGLLGVDPENLVYKVKWTDSPRVRLAITVKHMHAFLTKCVSSLPRSSDLAEILDTDTLTVLGAQDRPPPVEEGKQTEVTVTDDGSGNEKFAITLTSSDAHKFVPARVMQRLYEKKAESEEIKFSLEGQKAMLEYQVECKKAVYNDDANKHAATCEKIVHQVKTFEALGMHDEVNSLKRKLVEMTP